MYEEKKKVEYNETILKANRKTIQYEKNRQKRMKLANKIQT